MELSVSFQKTVFELILSVRVCKIEETQSVYFINICENLEPEEGKTCSLSK